jgi:hypothetical protein
MVEAPNLSPFEVILLCLSIRNRNRSRARTRIQFFIPAFRPTLHYFAVSGSSNSTRSRTLRAAIVTNKPNIKPIPDRPVNGLLCWGANKAARAQITAKSAQIAVLNLTILVRALLALFVPVSIISCSIRISPFTSRSPKGICSGWNPHQLPRVQNKKKRGFWEEAGSCD